VVRVGHFEKFLEMVLRLSPLALEVVLGDSDILLSRVASFLVIAIIMGHNSDVPGAPIMPLLSALGTFPSTLDGGFRRCCSATTYGCFHVAQDEGSPNRLLARGVPGGDIKQLLGGVWVITTELM
jgi:hypothetical protein